MEGRDPARGADQGVRRARRGRRHRPLHAAGRVLHAARPVRLREDHDAADDRRASSARRSGRIMLDGSDVARVPPHQRNVNTVFQSYALFPHLDVAGNVAFGLKYHKLSKEERSKRVGEALELVHLDRVRAAQGRSALRRPAAARGARARARAAAARAAPRRAARRARRAAAQEPPGRAQGAPGRARHHVRVRHPRSGGGAHDERPDRGDEQGQGRAGGPAARDLRGAAHAVRRRFPGCLEPARRRSRRARRRGMHGPHRRARCSALSRGRPTRAAT